MQSQNAGWQSAAKIKLVRLQTEAVAAAEAARAAQSEINLFTSQIKALADRRPALLENRNTLKTLPEGDSRRVLVAAELASIETETANLSDAINDATARYAEQNAMYQAKQSLAWDAKHALSACNVLVN